jgi:iron-sulfur cluster assembly accessory protein
MTITDEAKGQLNIPSESILYVKVVGGGCSGFQYKMSYLPKSAIVSSDVIYRDNNVEIGTDAKSNLFLKNTTIDFTTDGFNGMFVYRNPQAINSCGCGKSFR